MIVKITNVLNKNQWYFKTSLLFFNSFIPRSRLLLGKRNIFSPSPIRNKSHVAAAKEIGSSTTADLLIPGTTYEGFRCKNAQYYPEFNMSAYLLEHERLKTEYLHIHRNDNNNVFSVNFRTPAMDSTGLPHILEHLALCGSKKYPVRDPFFKMLNRSLATFMNAMTGPDYTLYPFSSTNEVDYRNLQSIYLDAVFKPNLKYLDFLQEGWRLENANLEDINSEIGIKGVVFNEMKGAFASNAMVLYYGLINNLLPNHTYGHVSGGEPLAIPNLSYDDLVAFHKKHYHPSNARIYSYGNFDVQNTLQYVNNEYLSQFSPIERDFSKVPPQKRWIEPKTASITCRFDNIGGPIEKQCQLAIGFATNDITDNFECLVLNVLGELLVRGPNSSFYKTLIEPNVIGGSFGQVTGYDGQLKDTLFAVALQNIQEKDFALVQKIFDQTVDEVIENGFDDAHVASILQRIELNIKHQSPKFGLNLLFNLTSSWNHDVDILDALNTSDHLQRLENNLKDKTYLQRKVKQYFKDNKHKLILSMVPDADCEKKAAQAEQKLLNAKVSALTDDDKRTILKTAKELSNEQKEKVSNAHLLPCLSLKDIPTEIERTNVETMNINGVSTQITQADTNGVAYVQGIYLGDHLSHEEQLLLPLLTEIFAQMGTKNHNYKEFDTLVTSKTAGIAFNVHFSENVNNHSQYELGVGFGSYCLEKNVDDMFQLINELLINFNLIDVQRFAVLLDEYRADLTSDIAATGHSYAMQSSTGLLSEGNRLKCQLNGFEHIAYITQLCEKYQPEEILKKLQKTAENLFLNGSKRYALNVSDSSKNAVLKSFNNTLANTVGGNSLAKNAQWVNSKVLNDGPICLHHIVTFPVNYCSKAFLTVPYVHDDYARLRILAKTLSSKYLLPVVREQNGAYGAGATIGQNGVFSYYSYRDPNTRKTLDTFDDTPIWLKNNWNLIDDQALFEAKLGVLQALDAPIAAGYKGLSQFKHGITDDIFAKQREQVLAVTRDDLIRLSDKYFTNNLFYGKCLLGPETNETIVKDNEQLVKNSGSC